METLLLIESKNLQKGKDLLLKDDVVSRASIMWKEAKAFGFSQGYYCYISGTEEQVKRAVELAKELLKEVKEKEKEKVIRKIKEEQDRALEGMGGIFG
jgi:alpha-D-ribose 1-methylphosphonate 5-triphosphate synthase subunit PhnG